MKKALIILGTTGLLVASVAAAKVDTSALKVQRAANAQVKCDFIETNVARKVTKFETNRNKHVTSYIKTKERVAALVTKLEAKGYDVTKLKADLTEYDAKIKKFSDDHVAYVAALTSTQEFACGKSEGEFKSQLAAARAVLKTVHDDSVAIRTYWAETVKPDILALKAQKITEKTKTVGGTE